MSQQDIFKAREEALKLHMSDAVERYIVELIIATRTPEKYGEDLAGWIEYGASPRGTIALERCARAHAWLKGRDFVSPEDVQAIIHDVLRHRILLSFEAEASGMSANKIINELINRIPVA
jgi:MoxR-like ATPase